MVGVAYNVFDGEELLKYSIESIIDSVDFIVVVAQEKSNFGNTNSNLRKSLEQLKTEGYIDLIHWYEPILKYDKEGNVNSDSGTNNEHEKRQIGLEICKTYGCNIFSSMDCDELYDSETYKWALNDFVQGEYDSSFCQMKTYYKYPTLQLFPPETYYVPLFYRIDCNTKFTFEFVPPYPAEIDPTRRIKAGYSRIYSRNEIEMHHFSYVRKDMKSKILNSSAHFNNDIQQIVLNHFNNFAKIEDGGLFLNNQKFDLIEVENKFKIEI